MYTVPCQGKIVFCKLVQYKYMFVNIDMSSVCYWYISKPINGLLLKIELSQNLKILEFPAIVFVSFSTKQVCCIWLVRSNLIFFALITYFYCDDAKF